MFDDVREWLSILFGFIGGGLGVALLQRKKTSAETEAELAQAGLSTAKADDLAWQHMVHAVKRLEDDVEKLLKSREKRDGEIETLQQRSDDCENRERLLVARLEILEAVRNQQ